MNDTAKIALGIVVGFFALFSLLFLAGGMFSMGPMMNGFGFFFMLLGWGIVIALVAGLVVWIVNQTRC